MQLLEGKRVAIELQKKIRLEVDSLKKTNHQLPHLAIILVGNDGASETYVYNKVKACEEVGFQATLYRFDRSISEEELLAHIETVNQNSAIHGLIVQLPLPPHISVDKITQAVHPQKDVDGFHPLNVGRLVKGLPTFISATPYGIMKLIAYYGIQTAGKHCVVIGRSQIVGTPMSILLSRNNYPGNATVTLCHSHTINLTEICLTADIIITALGKPHFLTEDMVKEGAVVIDVGTTRVEDQTKQKGYVLKGDVDFDRVASKCAYITPVPGGVGPMTILALLENTLAAARIQQGLQERF